MLKSAFAFRLLSSDGLPAGLAGPSQQQAFYASFWTVQGTQVGMSDLLLVFSGGNIEVGANIDVVNFI